ncbi:MAG: polyribonucleotide nucleotidyltransferase [Chloroflexi bacterium]|jgi:polyribonucleotide nucleotidyltransferase|nr:MAG: polyribonucleotide nucleotidyltransferase [Chloroflexota bacterium]|tara:strand:+ start:361 stop:2613 length:2253 start_codon:yes stop_codon:yes gene_type:complete
MNETKTFELKLGQRVLKVELGKIAQQANGSCTIQLQDTLLLVTAADGDPRPGTDFFPLTVDFEERMYAIGKIPGSFFKREGRAGNDAILAARMTDRPIRPMFPKGYIRDVHIVCTVMSSDRENQADVLGTIGASIALGLSTLPFEGPVSSVRVGKIDGELIAFPTYAEIEESDLELIVSGNKDSILMIEAGAKEVSEDALIEAISFAEDIIAALNDFQESIFKEYKIEKDKFEIKEINSELIQNIKNKVKALPSDLSGSLNQEGFSGVNALCLSIYNQIKEEAGFEDTEFNDTKAIVEKELKLLFRSKVINEGIRIDGRKVDEIRQLSAEVGFLPRVHGSGLFDRGETQVLSVVTLGNIAEKQRLDNISPGEHKRYMHHYNFPPFSVGEAGFMRGPGRREIGHGMLSEKALLPVLPSEEDFPYAIRVVSDVLSSNGSTSQASICGSSLSLMDAGVPITSPVAGIAMGLFTDSDSDKYEILTDIAGLEDAFGDMDFKIAGSNKGITAIQLDIKLKKLPEGFMVDVFSRAKNAREKILSIMEVAINKPRSEVSEFAPSIEIITVPKEKIGAVIGQGGKVIRSIEEDFECTVNIEDEGVIHISGLKENAFKAKEFILELVTDPEVGNEYKGKVVRVTDFGAFVNILPGKDGLVHISALDTERVEKVTDITNEGDEMDVKIVEVDNLGRINLTRIINGVPVEVIKKDNKKNSNFKKNDSGNDRNKNGRSRNFKKTTEKENNQKENNDKGGERSW